MSTETPAASIVRKAWLRRGYDDGLRDRPSGVEVARGRGGDPAAAAYLVGFKRGRRYVAEQREEGAWAGSSQQTARTTIRGRARQLEI